MTTTRTDPPARGDEVAQLRGYLDHHRDTLRQKTDDLDAAQLAATLPPSDMTLGGMVKHLAYVEDFWVRYVLMGHEPGPPWDTAPWDDDADWDWHSAVDDTPTELRALLDRALVECDALLDDALADGGADRLSVRDVRGYDGPVNVRWVLLHLIEEYARHNGHADLIRESIDGVTGT